MNSQAETKNVLKHVASGHLNALQRVCVPQTPISIGGDGGKYLKLRIAGE